MTTSSQEGPPGGTGNRSNPDEPREPREPSSKWLGVLTAGFCILIVLQESNQWPAELLIVLVPPGLAIAWALVRRLRNARTAVSRRLAALGLVLMAGLPLLSASGALPPILLLSADARLAAAADGLVCEALKSHRAGPIYERFGALKSLSGRHYVRSRRPDTLWNIGDDDGELRLKRIGRFERGEAMVSIRAFRGVKRHEVRYISNSPDPQDRRPVVVVEARVAREASAEKVFDGLTPDRRDDPGERPRRPSSSETR